MRLIYKIGIRIYFFFVLVVSLFNEKARLWIRGRRGIWKKLKKGMDPSRRVYWFHCSSLGEFEQGRPIIEKVREEDPDIFILLTFFSPSGYELRKNFPGADLVTYLPLDTRFNAWRFINLVKPQNVYFIKYEFWYYFLRTLNKKQIPVYLVSSKFRPDQVFFKSWGKWYRKFLLFFTHIFVQDPESEKLLRSVGLENVSISGDTRFDRVYEISRLGKEYPGIELFKGDSKVLIAGSTWEKDEELLVRFINTCGDKYKFILAPHELNTGKIYRMVSAINPLVVKFTDEDKSSYSRARVMIVDTIGHLSAVYKYGDIAYIGGGFGKGIHNILEAATYNLPVLFGPNYHKFNEAIELIEAKGAYSIQSYEELEQTLKQLFENEEERESFSNRAGEYVNSRLGATERILSHSFGRKK